MTAAATSLGRKRVARATILSTVGWAVMLGLLAVTLVLVWVDPTPEDPTHPNAFFVPLLLGMVLSFGTVGALLANRRPANPIGWMLLVGALFMSLTFIATEYHNSAVYGHVPDLPDIVYLIPEALFQIGLVLGGLVVLVFPTGTLPRYGRQILGLIVFGVVLAAVATVFTPGPLPDGRGENPLGVAGLGDVFGALNLVGNLCLVAGFLAATTSMIRRLLRAHGDERKQLEWFAFVAVLLTTALLLASLNAGAISDIAWTAAFAAFTALPIAIAVAVLKYHLYDIDTLVSRTLVYVPLVGILGGLYAAAVALFQRLFVAVLGQSSDGAIVLATLVIAGAFTPIRRSLETAVDKRFRPVNLASAEPASVAGVDVEMLLADPRVAARMEEIARRVAADSQAPRADAAETR